MFIFIYAYTLNLNFGLLGGAKKKKKKVYKKPKKEKHKKKKVKLAVLKFYKVGDDGKVFRLKRQCDNCAPGTLMASHFDRDYCIPYELQKLYKNGRHLEDEELLEIDESDYVSFKKKQNKFRRYI
ncbi:ubiquitin-40S ribosomal protein S27a [Plasmodium falciparum UGT5.1]|uniref:Ubiquitin-40S ribosomal protein S27a n=1 Tax=Plasmodium falciparum UGT5.1 TaxID=1237627 RepID=W7JHB2_PLAFA|nr:ubiquitin-40S ribosomal protein S27a [Plasmodium falciparum UGT5.1]